MNAPHTGKQLSPERRQLVLALLQAKFPIEKIARAMKVSNSTVAAIKRNDAMQASPEEVATIRKGFGGKLWFKANAALDTIDDSRLKEASASQLAVITGILTEKALLMEGKATSIIDYRALSEGIIDVDSEIVELEKRIAATQPPKLLETTIAKT